MRTNAIPRSRQLSEAAEHQMRMWAMRMESQRGTAEETPSAATAPQVRSYIAISRETGTDAAELAAKIASRLGIRVFDREMLDYMVENYHWSRIALESVDEQTVSWFHETFGKWLDQKLVSQAEFVHRLGKLVLLAAQNENLVFVGRGVQFILPRELGCAVRIIAPKKARIQRTMEMRNCGPGEAKKYIDETDKGRRDFVRRYFHHDVANPHLYDLTVNLGEMDRQAVVDLIVADFQARFLDGGEEKRPEKRPVLVTY